MSEPVATAEPDQRRRQHARWHLVLGLAVTAVGLVWLVLTEPVAGRDLVQPRLWAMGLVVVGLIATTMALIDRAWPTPPQRPSRPKRPSRLFLVLAGVGFGLLITRPTIGPMEPQDLVSPAFLAVYPLAFYGYQRWRYRRLTRTQSQATAPALEE
jgi:membrane protease YdiL (CAAX protease family)